MLFIETSIFTKQIKELVSDDEYRELQQELLVQPDKGDLIKNGGGIRKVRCAQGSKGKSGGIRVIYYWITEDDQIFMLLAYPKSVKEGVVSGNGKYSTLRIFTPTSFNDIQHGIFA